MKRPARRRSAMRTARAGRHRFGWTLESHSRSAVSSLFPPAAGTTPCARVDTTRSPTLRPLERAAATRSTNSPRAAVHAALRTTLIARDIGPLLGNSIAHDLGDHV